MATDRALNAVQVKQTLTAIMDLSAASREALILVAIEGFSYREAAICLDVPIGTVMSRLARARKQLTETLDEPAATLTAKR